MYVVVIKVGGDIMQSVGPLVYGPFQSYELAEAWCKANPDLYGPGIAYTVHIRVVLSP